MEILANETDFNVENNEERCVHLSVVQDDRMAMISSGKPNHPNCDDDSLLNPESFRSNAFLTSNTHFGYFA